jgi:photosystem II stability/assembly factor-like uncharacterized protein
MVRTARRIAALAALTLPLLALTMAGAAGAAPLRGTALSADRGATVQARPVVTASVRVSRPALDAVSFADLKSGWAVGAQGAILRTRDGGSHWVRQYVHGPWLVDPTVFTSVQAVSSKVCWVVGGAIYKTTDAGKTWTRMARKLRPAVLTGNLWQEVAFPTAKVGWVVSACGDVIHTSDAGKTWTRQRTATSGDEGVARLVALNARTAFIGDDSVGGHTLLGTSDGIGWKVIGPQPFWSWNPQIVGVYAASAQNVFLAASTGEVFASEDGGLSWRPSNPDVGPTVLSTGVIAGYESTVCAFGNDRSNQAAAILSTDSGRSWLWMRLATATGAKPFGVTGAAFVSAKTLWLVDVAGDIFRTQDGGNTWQKQR